MSISKKVVKKIKEEKITPKPKWEFILLNLAFWITAGIMIILGSIAFSLILFAILDLDWDLYRHMTQGMAKFFFVTIPHLWISFLVLFSAFSYLVFRKTKKGYRYNFLIVAGAVFLSSLLLGGLAYSMGIDEELQSIFSKNIPHYQKFAPTKEEQWGNPQMGFLGGEIKRVYPEYFILHDFHSNEWRVIYSESLNSKCCKIKAEEKVKIIGEKVNENTFKAEIIRPWEGRKRPLRIMYNPHPPRPMGTM